MQYFWQAIINVDDYGASAQALAATTLRNVLGTRSLGEILSDRVTIATEIYELLVEGWHKKYNLHEIYW